MLGRKLTTAWGLSRLVWSYGAFSVLRHAVPLETLVRWAWREPRGQSRDAAREARLVAQAIKLGHLFRVSDRHCLQRSLTLYRALSRAGASPSLSIGFRPGDSSVEGHAWITVDGRPVAESVDVLAELTPACTFGAGGAQQTIGDPAALPR